MRLFTGPGNCARKKNDNVAMEANKETINQTSLPGPRGAYVVILDF